MLPADKAQNHPLARRMLLLAFLLQTTAVSCLYGPFTIMLTAVEARTHTGRGITSLGIMLASLASGLLAPSAGYLTGRVSLRVLAMIGLSLSAAGYVLLATSGSIYAFLVAYGLLIGPGACLSTIVVPSVLVTRWFSVGRGRALGIVHMPIMSMITPIVVAKLLNQYGLSFDYLFLAALLAVVAGAAWLIVDHPPGYPSEKSTVRTQQVDSSVTPGKITSIIGRPVFWALALSTACVLAGGIVMGTHLAPMVMQWGVSSAQAATLVSLGSLASIAGALLFGWLADKIGGARTIAIICVFCILLWLLILQHPGYLALTGIVALSGLNLAGVVPAFTLALSRVFPGNTFGPAFGAGTFVFMAVSPIMAPVAGAIFARTGTYDDAMILLTIILAAGILLALAGVPPRAIAVPTEAKL